MGTDPVDEDIRRHAERAHRNERLARRREALTAEIEEAEARLAGLEEEREAARSDVARLEGTTFAAFLATLTGGKEEKLARERLAAEAAGRQAESARSRLEWLRADLEGLTAELDELASAPADLAAALDRKERLLRESGDPRVMAELVPLTDDLAGAGAELRETEEALAEGDRSLEALEAVTAALGRARGASTFDLISQNTVAGFIKHGELGKADEAAWRAQRALDAFARELADLGITANPRLPDVEAPFAEVFFNHMAIDARRHRRVMETRKAVDSVVEWTRGMMEELRGRQETLRRRHEELQERRHRLLTPGG
ncbi:hypothetical protein OUY22_36035 [Nonomuraea sp. MCN248]|uniref:Uncharacterized protein n=1 Tax=Nonomuraea corallina TaxID=2989783 RepID=A0ABT4SNN6_9ACTN|nr:hypothetical protein [Nonomuraea corallina]MDA0638852.1 hypothetical protein [Nonomuraea corallina]